MARETPRIALAPNLAAGDTMVDGLFCLLHIQYHALNYNMVIVYSLFLYTMITYAI